MVVMSIDDMIFYANFMLDKLGYELSFLERIEIMGIKEINISNCDIVSKEYDKIYFEYMRVYES